MDLKSKDEFTWIKADFHLHTAEDALDAVDYSALELLDEAHRRGFGALAITLHERVFHDERVSQKARDLGILLIPGAELRIEEADVVVLNLTAEEASHVSSFGDLRRLRAARGNSILVFAPHPFYHIGGSIGRKIHQVIDCFDAIEHCHFHIPFLDPNRPAIRLARQESKPLLATSDSHRRVFFGDHYSLLGVEGKTPTIESVFTAIRADRIRRVTPTGGVARLLALLFFLFVFHPILKRVSGRSTGSGLAEPKRPQRKDLAPA